MLSNFFVKGTTSLVRGVILVADYIKSLQSNYRTTKCSYNKGDKSNNMIEGNDDIVEKQEKDMKNNNNDDD